MKFNAGLAVKVGEALVDAALSANEEKQPYSVVYCDKMDLALALKGVEGHEEYGYKILAQVIDTT
tara:strand:- start:68 stop:262 length:195 start_codon:yes stop_codon:yes gene_type:complete